MKWINSRETGNEKLAEIVTGDIILEFLLIHMTNDKTAHDKKQIHQDIAFGK